MSLFGPSRKKAEKALKKGDFESAIHQYRELLAKSPGDHEMHNDLGFVFLEAGNATEAIKSFLRANEIHEHPVHWNNLGRAYLSSGQHGAAAQCFGKASAIDPTDPQPRYNLSVCYREEGRGEDAESELESLVESFPDHAGANNDLALFAEERGDRDKALEHLRRAVEAEPAYVPARLNIVRVLCDLGRFPESTSHLERVAGLGAKVVVAANDGNAQISIDGRLFWEGSYEMTNDK